MAPQTKPTLLIVDDAPENLVVLSELLAPHYRVLAATSGESCLRIANIQPTPDLILLDVMMPGMDGYTVLARLRESPVTREVPVIFVGLVHRVWVISHANQIAGSIEVRILSRRYSSS